ncbi:MAG: enoyl-CoA hydratase/isomerase family protein [Acidobacteriia bacterium]|jgi:enoyl-CoA hydratase/carnithine racemase|nr:enoyl-CoA hydratase/isomerase family protein [Terriglobia bacterium]
MNKFKGKTLSLNFDGAIFELRLHREPCNEIGLLTLNELELCIKQLKIFAPQGRALIIHSSLENGFSAGADLRELYFGLKSHTKAGSNHEVQEFLERIHQVFNIIDGLPLVTIAAVHGVVFGGGFELALTCDIIVAGSSARFCFPELRLGLIPGFGGIPRLKRDVGNALIRDLLLTGRSINANKALSVGLISQVVAPKQALRVARAIASQSSKFDQETIRRAKQFTKVIPQKDLEEEIKIFCSLISRPEVKNALHKFVTSKEKQPYLP